MVKCLTVGELIERLEKCPKDYMVSTDDGGYGYKNFEDCEPMIDNEGKTVYI